jgi:hypothetical protein
MKNGAAEKSEQERGFGLCSAHLQVGICFIPKCPPEGGRYKNLTHQAAVRDALRGGGFCARASRRMRSVSAGSGGQAI